MKHGHDAFPEACQLLKCFHKLQLMEDIEVCGRLVEENIVGVLCQSHSNIGILPHTARKRGKRPVGKIRNSKFLERSENDVPILFGIAARIAQMRKPAVQNQLPDGHIGNSFALRKIGDLLGAPAA